MYYSYLRYRLIDAISETKRGASRLTKLMLLISSEQILKKVLAHFEMSVPNGEGFLEVANAYNQSVIDLSWATVLHGIEKKHWEFVAMLLASDSVVTKINERDVTLVSPLDDYEGYHSFEQKLLGAVDLPDIGKNIAMCRLA